MEYLPKTPEMSFLFPDLSATYSEKISQLFSSTDPIAFFRIFNKKKIIYELLNSLILVIQTIKCKLSALLISHPKNHIVSHDDLLKLYKKISHINKLPLLYKLAEFYNEVIRNQLVNFTDLAYSEARAVINTCYQLIDSIQFSLISHELLLALRNPLSQLLGRMDISKEQANVITQLLEKIRDGSVDSYYKFDQKIQRKIDHSSKQLGNDPAEIFYILAELLKIFEDCDSVEQQLMVYFNIKINSFRFVQIN